ncbi:MAG: hypothetical protein AAGA68_06600 [Pseudomonadota bacterium]
MSERLGYRICLPEGLEASRAWSDKRLRALRAQLARAGGALDALECVAAAGSLGRREAAPDSDVDCVVVGSDGAGPDAVERAMAEVLKAIESVGLRAPKRGGFFRQVVRRAELLDPRRLGSLDESPQVYGKRLQCLLDARAVTQSDRFGCLRGEVLRWFTIGQGASAPFALLASELVRYRRSYVAYQTYDFAHGEDDSWRLRMVKLRSSRLVTVAGLLALVGESTTRADPIAFVEEHLELTALERLLLVMGQWKPATAERVARHYAIAHQAVADGSTRRGLIAEGGTVRLDTLAGSGDAAQQASPCSVPAALDAALIELAREVNDFFLTQRRHWSGWFFQALLL